MERIVFSTLFRLKLAQANSHATAWIGILNISADNIAGHLA
jgi:hypothetical protein